jgi:GTP cyclohydrolase-4
VSDTPVLRDVQASAPPVGLALSRAGVTGVRKAIRIRHGDHEILMGAEIDCTVDLARDQKGVHMSRFPELFDEAIDEVVLGQGLLVEVLAERIATQIVERQNALRAEVRIVAGWPQRRRTPVTGLQTQEIVSLIGIAASNGERARRVVGVEATGINACPCAQDLVRGSAAERLADAGFGEDVERILELVPLATHNQRGRGTLLVGTVERSMSAPVYELLKRPDELHVVEQAHRNPRFVEDSVRIALEELLATTPDLDDADFVLSRQRNLETIHDHDVVAERWGTVGEIRAELGGAEPALEQTTLEAWLRA